MYCRRVVIVPNASPAQRQNGLLGLTCQKDFTADCFALEEKRLNLWVNESDFCLRLMWRNLPVPPKAFSKASFFRPAHITIDGRRAQRGMP